MKQKIFSLVSVIIILCMVLSFPASATYNSSVDVKADIVLLASLDDGTVLIDKNADKRTPPASLTKIVTAILVFENCTDLDEIITTPKDCIDEISGTGSSNANIKPGEQMSIRTLLYCMLVKSANEAANILGDFVAGDMGNFVSMMNQFVVDLGCKNTHFVNCHGLDDPEQYTTAEDLLKITVHALEIPEFKEITSCYKHTVPKTNMSDERYLHTTNWLLNPAYPTYYYEYASGVKTGSTTNAGRCVISTASKDGYNYVCIVLGAPNDDSDTNQALLDCKAVFKWVFKNIKLTTVASTTQVVSVVDVDLSWDVDHVRLVPDKDVNLLVPTGNDAGSVMVEVIDEKTPKSIHAPVKKGDYIGQARIMYAGEQIATVDLVAAESINRSFILWTLYIIKTAVTSTVFKLILLVAAVLVVAYIVLLIRYKKRKKKKRKRVQTVRVQQNRRK